MSSPVGLAVSAQDAFALESSLLDHADRGVVVCCRLSEHSMEAKFAQTPGRCQP